MGDIPYYPFLLPPVPGPKGDKGEKGDSATSVPGFYSGTGPPDEEVLASAAPESLYLDLTTGTIYKRID